MRVNRQDLGAALRSSFEGQPVGTVFLPGNRLGGRKHWLAFTSRTRGKLVIDAGARSALVERVFVGWLCVIVRAVSAIEQNRPTFVSASRWNGV